jgi:hypothetical protein
MTQPNIQGLAVYRIKVTSDLLEEGMEVKYGWQRLSESEREKAKGQLIEEISSAVLIELLVTNPDDRFNLSDIHQPGSDQAAYDEVYLSEDGRSVIPTRYFEIPKGEVVRVGFYLHSFDPDKPLVTSYGVIELPPVQDMPEYLQKLIPYHPVD